MKASDKDILRQILCSPRRFVAIFLVVALGVAFYSGVRSTSPDMRITVDRYFDDYNASDLQLFSTMGFDSGDIDALRGVDGVGAVAPGYSVDGFLLEDQNPLLVSFQSLDMSALAEQPDRVLNRPELVQGRYPERADECLIDDKLRRVYQYKLGDAISVQTKDDPDITDSLNTFEYKVVGIVRSVQYISIERGSSIKGDGVINAFVYLPEQNFKLDVFTQVFLKAEKAEASRFSEEYKNAIKDLTDRIKEKGKNRNPGRLSSVRAEAEKKLADGRRELADAEKKLSEGERELLDGEEKLKSGERELAANRFKFDNEMKNGLVQLNDAKRKLDDALATLNARQKELGSGKAESEKGRADLEKSSLQLVALSAQLAQLPAGSDQAAQLSAQLAAGQQQYDEGKKKLDASEAQLIAGEAALNQGRADYNSGKAEYEKNKTAYESGKADGAKQLDSAQRELDASKVKLADARKEFEEKQPDALSKIEAAKKELSDGEKKLADLKVPEWIALGLYQNYGFAGFQQDADRVAAIGLVFPIIFFLVAALVSLTNMTRMVEDDRTTIGVRKALGYGRFSIAMKYLIYSGLAAVGGIILGVSVGAALFPRVIFNAYGILYDLPPIIARIHLSSAVQAGAGALLCAVLPAFLVCQTELMSTPASLMRPRAPKLGRRILLERLTVVWKRLNFSQKVTCRNLFRYKKRLLMTVLGIAGCTALVYTGFGIKDSIKLMVPLQYNEIQKYDMSIGLADSAGGKELGTLNGVLENSESVVSSIRFHRQEVDAKSDGITKTAELVVSEDEGSFQDFIALRDRRTGRPIQLTDTGVVVSEKLGRMLQVKKGDTIVLGGKDKPDIKVTVDDLTENYIYHYVYMTPVLYKTLYRETAADNSVLGRLDDKSEKSENALSESLLQLKGVKSVSFNTEIKKHFTDMVGAMDVVVLVLILSAAALAFVVLFSLTSINIDERNRELATLKVLGFYNNETSMYLYRENLILTLLGIGVGLILGIFMLSFVLITAEMDMVMFARRVSWMVYVLSALITFGFAVIVNLIMNRFINRIDMVESLKSVE